MDKWHSIYITDKTGKKFFNTNASPMATMSEIRNLTRHLDAIKQGVKQYENIGIDAVTAILMLDGEEYKSIDSILDDDDDLLSQLLD